MECYLNTIKILILQNNESILQISQMLEKHGFYVDICDENNQFLEAIYNNLYDLYIINIDEQELSKFELIKLLNDCKDSTMKMVLSSNPSFIKPSFVSGCDECVIKTTDEKEILLRIKALIRRQFNIYTDSIYIRKNIQYEIFNKKLYLDNEEIILGEKPLLILDYLLKFRNFFVSTESLENGVYPANTNNKNGVIRFHIHKIRQLLGNDIILSNRTNGYKINL